MIFMMIWAMPMVVAIPVAVAMMLHDDNRTVVAMPVAVMVIPIVGLRECRSCGKGCQSHERCSQNSHRVPPWIAGLKPAESHYASWERASRLVVPGCHEGSSRVCTEVPDGRIEK